VTLPVVRDELIATLEETLELQQRLVAAARDRGVPVTELVAQATLLERLDGKRDELISQLRRTASAGLRARRQGPPIREVVLTALGHLGWPQNAGFLEEYLWAERQLQVDSRAFAPLRRDERRSWQRVPGSRRAYIVPALNADGSANPRWLTSSAWPLQRRVVASATSERLFDLQKVHFLGASASSAMTSLEALLWQYGARLLGLAPPSVNATPQERAHWRRRARECAAAEIRKLRRADDPRRIEIARELAPLPEADRLWGLSRSGSLSRSGGARMPGSAC
jgi:hypothetical protein